MKFGIMDHLDASGLATADQYGMRLDLLEAADRLGFYSYHVAEHHGTPLGLAPSPNVYLSAVAQRTKRLKLGPMVYVAALYHPMRLAEEACMLDQLSHGRLQLGIGRGAVWPEQALYDIDPATVPERYAEARDILLQALTSERVSFKGKYFRVEDFPMVLRPYQKPRPPLWYGIGSPGTAVWAVKNRVNLMSNLPSAGVRELRDAFHAEWAKSGSDPAERPLFGSTKFTVVADTDAEAERLARSAYAMYGERTQHLARMYGTRKRREWFDDFDQARAAGLIAAGSPTTVRDYLADFIEVSGIDYLAVRVAFGDLTLEQSRHSFDLLTERVFGDLAGLVPATR